MSEHVYKTTPYAHQREAFERDRDREHHALLMEQGTGKTKVIIDTLAWLFNKGAVNAALVVAPKSICRTWARDQIPVHLSDTVSRRHVVVWSGSPKKAELKDLQELFQPDPLCLKVLVMNVEALSLGTKKNPGKAFVFAEAFLRAHRALMAVDESTTIKSPDANRSKNVIRLGQLAAYRRILTGTPVTQSPLDIFNQFDFLASNLLECGNYYSFRNRYAQLRRRVINGRSFDEVVGFQRLDELRSLIDRNAYRKLKVDCLDLPPKVYQTRYVELGAEQERLYNSLRDSAMVELDATRIVTAPLFLTRLLRLRQILAGVVPADGETESFELEENPRLRVLLEALEETRGKAIIWVSFVKPLLRVVRELNTKFGPGSAVPFYGDVPAKTRQDIVECFQSQNEKPRFFVGQVRTGGLGLTLTAAHTVIYFDHDWSLEARAQSEDRAHRIGQTESVTYIDLVAEGTVDETIISALRDKRDLADLVTGDGWRRLLRGGPL